MTAFVRTAAIREAVKGRETEILDALGIPWRDGRPHVACPYPTHQDANPSWRWDEEKSRAFCTCTSKGHSILDVIMGVRSCDYEAAKLRAAELLGRNDLIRTKGETPRYPVADAARLLNPHPANRDDSLVTAYLAHRLGVQEADVPLPSTPTVGLKSVEYFDSSKKGPKAKPKLVGLYPCAVFRTAASDGRTHAHRIYLAPEGYGKAALGSDAEGRPRDAKKSAKILRGVSTAGCAVLWGDPDQAPWIILAEGIETAAAIALAFQTETAAGKLAVAAAISAAGMAAFGLYAATHRVTVAADRDEAPKAKGAPPSRAGEKAARSFAMRNHERASIAISLPGSKGTNVDWLDVLTQSGTEAVRAGILAAVRFVPTEEERDDERKQQTRAAALRDIECEYPLPSLDCMSLRYEVAPSGKVKIHKVIGEEKNEETGETHHVLKPIATPFTIVARLRHADREDAYGLRVLVQGMDGKPRVLDIDRSNLSRTGAQEVRAMLMAAGLRTEDDGEMIAVAVLKGADPDCEIVMVNRPGWHRINGLGQMVFIAPSGEVLGLPGEFRLELAHAKCLAKARSGTLEGWQRAVQAACDAENCHHWLLGVLAGWAGLLIALTGLDTCGINLSGLSSGGKTLAQKLAVSAWSTPQLGAGLLHSMRTTENGLEHLAGASHSTVLALDEAAHVDGRVVGRMIYSISSGTSKTRATRDGGLQERQAWATYLIVSGECSLENKVTADGGQWLAGMAVRVVDVDVNGVNRNVDAITLSSIKQIEHHYGHAGPAFVAGLMRDGYDRKADDLRKAILEAARKIAGEGADGARVRAATALAVLQVAGTLAKRFSILDSTTPVADAVTWAWDRFLASSDAAALSPDEQAISNIRRWIAERWDVTIKPIGPPAGQDRKDLRTNNREAVGWYDADTVYIPVPRVQEAAGGAVKEQFLSRLLSSRNLLTKRTNERRAAVRSVPGIGKVDCYALDRAEFGRACRVDETDKAAPYGAFRHG